MSDEPAHGRRAGAERRADTGSPAAAAGAVGRATTGAATRLAEEMRREAEMRSRAAQPAGAKSHATPPETNGGTREDLARASAAAREFLERLGQATGELAGLLGRVQDSAATLAGELGSMAGSAAVRPQAESSTDAAGPPPPQASNPAGDSQEVGSPDPASAEAPQPPSAKPSVDAAAARGRLLAFNMALNGASREETARYLTENLPLVERTDLLNEVYARAAPESTVAAPSEVIKDL